MKIALTGTIGSGKSSVTAILANALNAVIQDTDQLCRQLLEPGEAGWRALRQSWPATYFNAAGELDRRMVRETIANDHQKRQELEAILHPLVRQMVTCAGDLCHGLGRHLLVEVPLLFETGWQEDFDCSVVVYVPRSLALARTMQRDGVSQEQTERILALQKTGDEKCAQADLVIDNSGIWLQTVLQVYRIAHDLRQTGGKSIVPRLIQAKSLTVPN